jgi:hypothetical protein
MFIIFLMLFLYISNYYNTQTSIVYQEWNNNIYYIIGYELYINHVLQDFH